MVYPEIMSLGWTDAMLKLLLNLHKHLKLGPETAGDKDFAPLTDEEWKALKALQKELKARSQAMKGRSVFILVFESAQRAHVLVSHAMQQCIDKIKRILAEDALADARTAVSELAAAYVELVLAIGAEYTAEADFIKDTHIDNAKESTAEHKEETSTRVELMHGGRWEPQYAGEGSSQDLLDAWAGELLVNLKGEPTDDTSQTERR
ncbi:hypothetical protein QFC20_006212 [Naganishia adeliensis]|uniref:Uncharacterized protein n=1 Tax=Naganishia adeliensis TaxID=92952 RepID=A0ACC2VDD8_9TREE|nr:hypothetical protein QFC20_006212 [Naganishia adeliensis]